MITLRPVNSEDREFLLQVYAASRGAELAMVPWDDAMKRVFVEHQFDAQRRHYDTEYKNVTHEIILLNNEPAGRIYLSRGNELTAILDLTVIPAFRRRGVATELLRRLQAEGKRLRVFIEPYNPGRQLFLDLGFEIVKEDEANLELQWQLHEDTQ